MPGVSTEPSLRERIRSELLEASWDHLVPHQEREAVIAVHHGLDLVEAAVAIAENATAVVAAWLGSGHLQRLSDEDFAALEGRRFTAAIVQPFVVVALLEEPAGEA